MAAKIKNRHRLKEKEVKEIIAELHTKFPGIFFDPKAAVDVGTMEQYTVVLVNDSIDFLMYEHMVMVTLQGINTYHPTTHFVVVDMGAVGFVTKGADVMAPGIRDADPTIQVNDIVWVCDERYRKPLAVGVALMSGEEMRAKKTGKAVKTVHYVGDPLWVLMH